MTPEPTPAALSNAIPFTAWEQAVFVALFVVFVLSLLAWFSRQQNTWQDFIQARDAAWQKFLAEQRADDKTALNSLAIRTDEGFRRLTDATTNLTKALDSLHQDVDIHIADESAMLDVMLTSREKSDIERRKQELDTGQRRRRSDKPHEVIE
jgi:hypothetical protein